MIIGNVELSTSEKKPVTVDFTNELAEGETISSIAIASTTPVNLVSSSSFTGTTISVAINGTLATNNTSYHLTIRGNTNFSGAYEADISLSVQDSETFIFTKQPNERFTVEADFTDALASGDTVTTAIIAAMVGNTDVTGTVIGTAVSGTKTRFVVLAGTSGIVYRISVIITTLAGYQYQQVFLMNVKEK